MPPFDSNLIATAVRPEVTLDGALAVLHGIRDEAARRGVALAAAVVDLGGNVVASIRMDGAQLVAGPLATDKAWTAVACGAPTERWAPSSAPGGGDWGFALSAAGRVIVFAGGLPLYASGKLVGGAAASGAAAEVDRACVAAGLVAAGFDEV